MDTRWIDECFCNEHAGFTNERGIIAHWINVRTDQCVQKRCMLFSASKSQRRLPEVSPSPQIPGLMLTWHYNVLVNSILKGSRISTSNDVVINMLLCVAQALGSRGDRH